MSGMFLPAHRAEKRSFVFSDAVFSSSTSFAFPAFRARAAALSSASPFARFTVMSSRPRKSSFCVISPSVSTYSIFFLRSTL